MSDKNDSRGSGFFKKTFSVSMFALFIIFILAVLIGIYFFGLAGIFHLFGASYDSIGSLIWFAVWFFLLGFVLDLFAMAFHTIIKENISGKYQVAVIRIVTDTLANWLALFTVDEFMTGITVSVTAEVAAALLMACIELALEDKNNEKKIDRKDGNT